MKIDSIALENSICAAYEFVHGKGAKPSPAIKRGIEKHSLLIIQTYLKSTDTVEHIVQLIAQLPLDQREQLLERINGGKAV